MRRKTIPFAVILTVALGLPLGVRAEKVPAAPVQKSAAAPNLVAFLLAPPQHSTPAATYPRKLSQTCDICTLNSDCPQRNVCQVICDGGCCTCLWYW